MTTKPTIKTSTIRPGLLVSLKTSMSGNLSYQMNVIEGDHLVDKTGEKQAKWETTRTVANPEEHEAAKKARSLASSAIRKVCTYSAFGLLCPEANADVLKDAIAEARGIVREFNDGAEITRLSVNVLVGRIAADDVEATKAITSEVRELMEMMTNGLGNLDVKAVREAAARAKELANMLTPEAEARVKIAVETAREAAKKIVKAGEQGAAEIDKVAMRKITEVRGSFLDLDDVDAITAPKAKAAAVDLLPGTVTKAKAPKAKASRLEM